MAARLWHKAPFIRILLSLACGIVAQWYLSLSATSLLLCFAGCFLLAVLYSFLPIYWRYQIRAWNGVVLCTLLASAGGLLVWLHDIRNNRDWLGLHHKEGTHLSVTLEEPLVEKANSYKALATGYAVYERQTARPVEGKVLLYFKKDSLLPPLAYGSQIIFSKPLQEIKNSGNPGSFDYKTYSLYQGVTHQVYLTREDYVILSSTHTSAFKEFLFQTRYWVVNTLQQYIEGEKEQGLAEALLIGYKDDLDKNLVQAYSNTGVVHIIAISGLHLGLIYGLLLLITRPLQRNRKLVLLRLVMIITSLWLFSLLAGAQPSVLRSALMFTLIAVGEVVMRRSNIYNTLAFSAAILLCINPFWLWDVGFQLSYSAVLSIVLFYQPVYNWISFHNKLVDFLWKLMAITMAAQVLTLPISIYHFHQAPLLFLFSNFIAVPLSSVILVGEILLCALAFLPVLAKVLGMALHHLIYWMNSYVERIDNLPFAVWGSLSINLVQTILLLVVVIAGCYWLMERKRKGAWTAAATLAMFMFLRALSFGESHAQRKMIIYNVPRHTAIDVVNGRHYSFIGDTTLLLDDFARNFHLQPSRILHRISPAEADPTVKSFDLDGKQVVLMDQTVPLVMADPKPTVDVLVLSGNPRLYISQLQSAFSVKQIVIDGSVPPWKAALWKRDCDSLHIPCYNVGEKGAFVMNW